MSKIIDRVHRSPLKYLAILVVGAIAVGYTLSGAISQEATRLASFVSGVVLSYLLLVVYVEIRSSEETQADQTKKQTQILENQQELQNSLKRLQHERDYEATRWQTRTGTGRPIVADGLSLPPLTR